MSLIRCRERQKRPVSEAGGRLRGTGGGAPSDGSVGWGRGRGGRRCLLSVMGSGCLLGSLPGHVPLATARGVAACSSLHKPVEISKATWPSLTLTHRTVSEMSSMDICLGHQLSHRLRSHSAISHCNTPLSLSSINSSVVLKGESKL